MDFYQKYELLDLLKDEGVKVFNAREISTGRRITVFLFVGEHARLHADLLEQLRSSQRPDHPDLLEVGDTQGTPFVATEPLGGLADLKRIVTVSPAPPAAPRAGTPPDAFTKVGVWHVPGAVQSGARGATPVTPLPPAAPAVPPAQSAPGEFTRLFQASAPPQPIGETPSPAARPASGVPPPAPPAQSAPGEFTRLFQAAAPPQPIGEAPPPPPPIPAPPPLRAEPPAQSAPGEFTRLFQAAPPQPIGESVAPPAPAAVRPAQAALGGQVGDLPHGEFTRFFQSPLSQQAPAPEPVFPPAAAPQKPAPPPPASSAPGDFTRIFGKGDMPATPAAPPGAGASPATPAPAAGPGEYTRMFAAQPVLQPQPPAQTPAPAPAPTAPKKVPWLMLALIVAVVVLLAVVAIMAFALRK